MPEKELGEGGCHSLGGRKVPLLGKGGTREVCVRTLSRRENLQLSLKKATLSTGGLLQCSPENHMVIGRETKLKL